MATVACPDCGLPRVETELAHPCPVCAAPPVVAGAPRATPKATEPDPTAGLPADVSELAAPRPRRGADTAGSRNLAVGLVMFFLGVLVGVGAVFAFQAIDWSPKITGPELAANPTDGAIPRPAVPPAAPPEVEVAPMPHEPRPHTAEPEQPKGADPEPEPKPDPKNPPPAPGQVHTIDNINLPDGTFTLPFPMKKGEHVVLKGKAKALKITYLDGGAILDATELEVSTVTISKVDNGSTLKLKVPNGTVVFTGKIDNKSVVEVVAPGGDVRFSNGSRTKPIPTIDNGSKVTVTARVIEVRGDIGGTDTKVSILLTKNAWLKIGSISGKAMVDYRPQMAGWSPPDVIVGSVAATATFRRSDQMEP